MEATTDSSATDADRGWRVLVAVDRDPNRELLVGWFDGRADYEVCTHDDGLPDSFDVCLVDVRAFRRLAGELAERRAATEAYLPVMLLVSGSPDTDQWAWVGAQLGDVVDDVTTLPVRQQVLEARLRVLLRSRDLSLDLSDRGRELAEARHRLELALGASGQTVWEFDPDEGRISVHGGGDGLLGLGASYDSQTFREAIDPADRECLDEAMAEALSSGVGSNYELDVRFTHAETGEERWLELVGEVVNDGDGSLRVLGTGRDVTERKERERELERAQARLERAVVASNLRVWELDVESGAVTVHRWRDESMLGLRLDGFEDVDEFLVHVHPEETARVREAFRTAVEDGTPLDETFRVPHAETGELRWLELRAERRELGDGPKLVGTARDVTERKQRERELERTIDLFERTQTIADVGGWEYDPGGTGVLLTAQASHIYGAVPGETPDLETAIGYYHPDDRPLVRGLVERTLETGEPFDRRVRLAPDGDDQQWVRIRGTRVLLDDGTTVLRGATQDVTEQVEYEQELTASERRFRAVFETSRDAMLLADDDGRYVDANEAACELFGVEYEDLLGRHISEFAPEDYDFQENWGSFQAGDRIRGEFPLVRPDGTRRTIEFVATPDVLPGRHLSVVRDVTERKQRERELERHELVVRTAGDPIYTVGPDGRLTMANDALLDVADRPPEAVEGAPVSAVFGANHAETLADRVTRLLSDDELEGSVETRATFPDGKQRTYQTRIAVLPFEEEFRGYACVSHDVTDLREHQRRLSVLDRVLRHNLRNTMNVVLGHADGLTDAADPGVRETATAIRDAGEELLALGEAARRFQDTIDPHVDTTVETDLVEHVRHVVEEQRLDHPAATFETDLPSSARARAPEALDLALTEVVENAVVHCDHDDPRVEVSVATEDESVVVRVTDDGPGISSLTRRAIERGSEGPLEHATGLGLWLVRWTVAASDGTLDISERDPRGTVVELRFPLAQ